MVVSFIKKQLEGLKSDEEIIHLLKLANPDLTERRINSLMETAKQHADIPILDDKTVTTIRNAAKDGDHTAETMIRALPDASIEKRMHAKNVLYAERNEELFPLINPTILNKTVSRENGKLQVKNVNSVMPNIRIAGSRAEPQSVAMAIKHFEKIRTTRSHRAGGSIGSMNSLNPYLIFAKPVVHPPKWTHSFSDYQQRLQNTQFLASMAAPHHTSQSFKFYKSGGSLPSFASGKWVNPSLQRSAQQSALKLSQMKSVVKLQQLRKQAQAKQEAHAVLQQRISESTQRLMAMRRSTQSRMNAPRPNYDNMFNPMVDLMSRYPSGGMKRAFRTFRSIGSNFSMMDDVSLMNQAFNTTFGPYSGREFSINNHPALIPNIRLETDNKSHRGLTSRMFDENGRQISYANIARNNNNNNNLYSFAGGFGHCSIPPSVRRTHSSQHMLRLISDILAPSIPSNESGRLQIVDKDGVDVEKLLYHGFQVHPRHDDVLIKDFSGSGAIPTPVTSTPPPLTIPTPPPRITIPTTPLRAPPTRSMAALPSNLDADTVRKMLEPYTIGDSRERGFRLVHFKPGNEVDHSILQYIRDVSRIAEQESHDSSLNEMEQTGSSFAFSNVNNILNHLLNNNNKMGKYGMVAALRDDDLELMSALRYSNNREVNPSSTYVNIFGTRGTIRGKGVGSQVFIEAMKHAHDLGVTDFSLYPLSYRQTMKFYRRHGMDRSNHFDLARHVPRLLKEQEEFRGVSIDRQLAGIHGNSIRPESIMSGINRTVLETLKTRFSHAQGGSIPSFMDGGNPFDAIRENSIDRVRSLKMNYGMDKEKALRYYKGTYYDAINRFLETGDMNVSYGNKVLKNIQLKGAVPYLDQATSEHTAPSDVLHKGLSEYWMSFLQDKNVGDTVTFPGFLSTTTDMKTAMKHARSGLADIHVNKDTKGYQYLNDIEPEFLMQRGQSFKIQDILTSNNKSHYVLKHLMEQKALGGLIPSFESGGPQSIYNMNDASMLTSLLSPDQVDHSAKVMAHASHIWSMMNGSDKGHNILQNAASLHDIGKTIDPKAHGKLAGKFGSLLGIDKISKFLINNHSGTRQPSLKEFKKSQRSEVRKMLGALRLADVSARTGTLPLSMKKGSLKLGNTRGLDINKHQLQRIKSSLKMINRMNGGSIPSFMGGGWTGLLKYAHLTKTPESASRLISRNSVNSLQSMAENTGLHGLLSSMIKSGSPDSAFKGLFYRKGLDANTWMEKVHQMKLQQASTFMNGYFAQGGNVPRFDGGGDPWEDIKHLLNPKARCFPTNDHSIYRNKLATSACTNHVKLEDWDNYIWRRFNPDSLKFEDIQMLPGNEYDFIDKNGIPLMERLYDQYSLSTNPAHVSAIQRLNNIDLNKLFEYHNEDVDLFSLRPMNMVKDIIDNNFIKNEHAMSARYDVGALNLIDIDKRSNDKYGKSLRMLEKHMFSSDPNRQLIFKKHLDRANSLIHNLKFTDEEWEGMTDDYSPGARLLDSVKSKIFNLSDNRSLFDNTPYADLDKFKATMSTTLSDKYNTEPTGMFTKGMNNLSGQLMEQVNKYPDVENDIAWKEFKNSIINDDGKWLTKPLTGEYFYDLFKDKKNLIAPSYLGKPTMELLSNLRGDLYNSEEYNKMPIEDISRDNQFWDKYINEYSDLIDFNKLKGMILHRGMVDKSYPGNLLEEIKSGFINPDPAYQFMSGHQSISDVFANQGAMGWDEYPGNSVMLKHIIDDNDRNRLGFLGTDEFEFILGRNAGWNVDEDLGNNVFKVSPFFGTRGEWAFSKFAKGIPTRALGGSIPGYAVGALGHGVIQNVRRNKFFERFGSGDLTHDGTGRLQKLLNLKQFQSQQNDAYGNVINQNPFMDANIGRLSGKLNKVTLWDKIKRGLGRANGGYLQQFNDGGNPFTLDDIETSSKFKDAYLIQKGSPDEHFSDRNSRYRQYFKDNPDLFDLTNRIYEFGGQDLFQAFALSSLSEDNGLMQQLLLSNKTRSDQVTGWLKERGLLYTMSMDPKRGPKFSNHKNLWDALVDYHKIPMDQREGTAKELLQNYLKQITGRRSINWNTVGLSRRAQGGSGGIPALVSAKEAYLPPKMAGSLGSRRLDTLRSMADDNTLMDDIPELHKLFGGVPSINGAGVFAGGSGNPTADDIFTHLEPGSYILDYQTLEAMRKLDPRSVKFGGAISGMPIRRATGGVIGFAAGGFGDRVRAFASNFYNEFKYPYQAEQTRVGSSARLQTAGYGTFDNAGIFKPDLGVDAQNQAVIDKYQAELEDWAVNTFKHLTPEDAKKRVSAKIQEQTRNVVKGSGTKAVNVEETFKTLKPEVMFDSKDLEKIGKSSEDLVESFKNMTDNAFRDPNNSKKFFKTLNLGLVETEKHVQNVALEFTTLGKFSSHMKDFSFRLASVSMAAMGVNFSTMAVFQSITSGISQITAPFSDLESLMQNTGYLKAFGDAANVPVEAIQSLTGNTDGLVDTWKKIGGMTAYLQLSFASLGEALFKNDDMMEAFADGMEEVFVALKDPQTIRSMADLFTSMSQSLPVLADVVKGVAAALKLVADQPMIMQIMMYSTIFSMLLQPLFSLGSALLTFIGIGAGFINWSRGAVLAIKSLDIAFLGLNTTLVASLAYLALVALAIEGVARVYELLTGSEVTFKPSNIIMGALGFASDGDDYVEGAGTTTSDEIPYMLSRGERVVNATDNAAHYADYEALENNTIPPFFKRGAATGEDYVGGSPNLTDYRYYEGIKSVTSIDTMKADQDTADTLTAARDGNAIRVIVKNANEIGGRHEEQQNEIQAPFAGGTPQLERIINPAPGLKIFDILGKFKPDLKLDWKPDFKFDLGKLDFKFDLGKIIADLFKKGGEIKPDEKIDTKSEPKSTLDWYKSFIDQIKSARGSASDDDWKPNERYFNTEDLKPPKSSKTKGGIFDTFKKFIPDSLKGFAAPEFARGDITKGNVLKSIIADKGPLKTGTGMLGYANPLDIFSVLNILNAGRFGTGATVAETVNQTIGGAVTGLGVAGSLVGGGIVKAAGFSKIGTAIALPGQVLSKAALPLAAATPFLIGAEGAMANRRFLAGESIEDIKNTPFDELSSAEKFATVLTGGIGTSATANGLKVLVGMHGEEAARQSLIATQTGIDSIANWIPGLNILNRGLGAVGGPSIGEVGVGGAMALVGLPESISDFAHAVAGLPAWFASLSEPEDQGDQAGGSIAQTYDEMNKRIDTSGMQYVGKNNDEVVEWMNQQIAAQQQTQPNNISFTINAQPDVADQVYGIVDNALRSNGFYDGQRV